MDRHQSLFHIQSIIYSIRWNTKMLFTPRISLDLRSLAKMICNQSFASKFNWNSTYEKASLELEMISDFIFNFIHISYIWPTINSIFTLKRNLYAILVYFSFISERLKKKSCWNEFISRKRYNYLGQYMNERWIEMLIS